ncbi:ATP synthase subunit delta [uncultured Desulfobacterium sp.]|uniref:ATP synthase subunit delta n=1 Tax=uncultured Desulfobacterium sp. TaxID=201089 RepID=A0A445MZE7_9BACT|nr:ATP synthase subunit delta [uncultured Desulfobacterium sp.]
MIDSKISRRYAKALLSLGQEDGNYLEYGRNLKEFAEFCAANEEFFQVVSNQIYVIEDRKKILEKILEKTPFSDMVKNYLRLLLDKNRIGSVKEITDHYQRLTDDISNIVRAELITARPLKDDALKKIVQALNRLTSKDVKVEIKEDASIMGGLIVKTGDLVIDGSIKTQLEGLRESLKRGEYN